MATIQERLADIKKNLEVLVSVEKHELMTPERFLGYAIDQIAKAGGEPAAQSTARLKSLLRAVTIAKDNFTNDASESIKVPIFVDDQTALKDQSNKLMTPDQAGGSPPDAQNYVTKLAALKETLKALGEGAEEEEEAPESEEPESKKKAAEDTGEDDDAEKKKKPADEAEGEPEEKKTEKKVAKAGAAEWPSDMNDPSFIKKGVASSRTEEWGRDPK